MGSPLTGPQSSSTEGWISMDDGIVARSSLRVSLMRVWEKLNLHGKNERRFKLFPLQLENCEYGSQLIKK